MELPPDVHTVRVGRYVYYYYQKFRNTEKEGPRTALGKDPRDPRFWQKLEKAGGVVPPDKLVDQAAPAVEKGTVAAMILEFRGLERDGVEIVRPSPEWRAYEETTKKDYNFYLDKIDFAWGALPSLFIEPHHALALRNSLQDSPGSANYLLTVGRTLFKWGVPRQYAKLNPFREVEDLEVDDDGHWPWPQWAQDWVFKNAWPDLARFAFLGLHTGQRESDIVRLGPSARDGAGLWIRPKKTRKKRRKALWVPLLKAAALELDRWEGEPLIFEPERRLQPIVIPPGATYVLSPAGNPYTPEGVRSRWNRWLKTEAGQILLARWSAYVRARLERDGEEIAADATFKPALHGLRSTNVVARRMAGYSVSQIANDIGMSIPMVSRYSRFMDQREAAEANIVVLDMAREAKAARQEPGRPDDADCEVSR